MKENEKNENGTAACDPCEERFEKTIDYLVKEGEAPEAGEREKKEEEVREAFAEKQTAEK